MAPSFSSSPIQAQNVCSGRLNLWRPRVLLILRDSPVPVISFLFGTAVGLAIHQMPTDIFGTQPVNNALVTQVGHFYLPIFVAGSIIYLMVLRMVSHLRRSEYDLSLALIGLGVVYVSAVLVHGV